MTSNETKGDAMNFLKKKLLMHIICSFNLNTFLFFIWFSFAKVKVRGNELKRNFQGGIWKTFPISPAIRKFLLDFHCCKHCQIESQSQGRIRKKYFSSTIKTFATSFQSSSTSMKNYHPAKRLITSLYIPSTPQTKMSIRRNETERKLWPENFSFFFLCLFSSSVGQTTLFRQEEELEAWEWRLRENRPTLRNEITKWWWK